MPCVAPMTSVTCSACTQIITTESDRVYCFGGCEQILHIRCSELRQSDSNALRNNVALKYMCFACRKKQVCLNDLQAKCTELLERINEIGATVTKHETSFSQLENRLLTRIESVLMPALVSKIESMISTRKVNDNRLSYATVTRDATTTAVCASAVTVSPVPNGSDGRESLDEGWILRSGKRRGVTKSVTSTKTSAENKNSDNSQNRRKRSSNVQSTAVKKIEQTVIIKPKSVQQADVTLKQVRDKIDPVNFSVKGIRTRENGDVVVRCETSEHAQKLVDAAVDVLSDCYEISVQKPLKPRIKIIGLSEDLDASEFVSVLKKQNELPTSAEITLIRMRKIEKWKQFPFIAIIETDCQTFETLIQRERVHVRWDRCRVAEDVNVLRCFKCSKYGHKASSCNNPLCCPICTGDHEATDCDAAFEKCINCELRNKLSKSPYDEQLDVNHSAWSSACPVYQKRLKNVRLMVDYSA